ncbi:MULTISPECIES: carbohydrate ABC transporter permease [Petrotoga]|uniref:Carbohydrate ABC transporter membrane protein 1 (CUT1 family) n=2 Tax=Petrotoga sibirica TaxID=156202 RepID=A0A4V3GQL0_9BACT|nr:MULTISPECIES: sugar ABC transporter permease [Petrotoga]POZ89357.1 ABC transporter permease [Petrotoga sibirica DSM 13575]POZ91718.1 ABC transporter permease [Petrotoga sp. SL27]TDX15503.1 carbohydrate ABC transporter membrane protein 1 (CUT1 family) [Petrotoga sibirica]
MKPKTREALSGYMFASPVIIIVLLFVIYPIIMIFYYSFTNFNPLETQKFKVPLNPQETIELHIGMFQTDVKSVEEIEEWFDLLTFIQYDVGINLTDEQKDAVFEYFDTEKLLENFIEGKLNTIMTNSEFMTTYMKEEKGLFKKYSPQIVGLENFRRLFNDDYVRISLFNTLLYTLIVVPIQTFLAVLLGVAANSKVKGVKFYKVVFFLPAITSSAAISMIFWLIYSKPGILNRILVTLFGNFGYQPIDWLNNPNTALFSIMLMNVWATAGYFMITFLAGLQDIPNSLYEAADIDGATGRQKFWRITLPLLRPQILFVIVMGTIGCMQVFDQIYFLIENMRNITISFYIYKNAFEYGNMGYASSLALILFGIIMFITFLQRRYIPEEY